MTLPNHLVERFFRGDCTEDEKQLVTEFFRDNPEKLAQYLTENSWDNFAPDTRQTTPAEKMWEVIEPHTAPVKRMKRIRYGWLAAASIAAVVACLFLLPKNTTRPVIAATTPPKIKTAAKKITNDLSKAITFLLPDGSRIKISPNSTITFDSAFTNGQRDIFLQGEATFTVKKDTRPFIVHSKDITTTVLGTVFSVSDKASRFTAVHLFSGRVVIKKENDNTFKNIYLTPGQQLMIDKGNFTVQIKEPKSNTGTILPKSPATKTEQPQQVLSFTNQPLTEICSTLQKEYNIAISYDPKTLQNMTFTGRLDRNKESVESFLNTLCELNELTLKKTSDNSFSIQVKQP